MPSPLTLNGANRLSRETFEASQNAKSAKLSLRTNTPPRLTFPNPLPARTFAYDIPMTNIAIEFALFDDHPLNRMALQQTINSGQRWLRAYLEAHGDSWLASKDNPLVSLIPDQCFIRIDSLKAPNGRARMTYKTVLAVYDAFEEIFIEQGNEVEGAMRMSVTDIIVGHGIVTIKNPAPDSAKNGTVSDV
ncbi:MAG: hypothetical protein Q9195_003278 [Heterodermia aff. obscurata]